MHVHVHEALVLPQAVHLAVFNTLHDLEALNLKFAQCLPRLVLL